MKQQYPTHLAVKVSAVEGGYFIEIPELDVFTEATTKDEIPHMINDLVFTYFDVPKKLQKKMQYIPVNEKKPSLFSLMATADIFESIRHEA